MYGLLELVFEYRGLVARRHEHDVLDLPSRRRLEALHRLLGREPAEAAAAGQGELGRRRHARCELRLRAAMRVGGDAVAVEITNLGAGGICVRADAPLSAGHRGVLSMVMPDSGRLHECMADVMWARRRALGGSRAGLRFKGGPFDVRLAS